MSQTDQNDFTLKLINIYEDDSGNFICRARAFTQDTKDDQMPGVGGWTACLSVRIRDINGPIDWSMDTLISGSLTDKPPAPVVSEVEEIARRQVRQALIRLKAAIEEARREKPFPCPGPSHGHWSADEAYGCPDCDPITLLTPSQMAERNLRDGNIFGVPDEEWEREKAGYLAILAKKEDE